MEKVVGLSTERDMKKSSSPPPYHSKFVLSFVTALVGLKTYESKEYYSFPKKERKKQVLYKVS